MKFLSPERALIFRITHVQNLPWILENGLHARASGVQDPGFRAIGNAELIAKRRSRKIPIEPGGDLGDYIPFYFTPRSPMLFNIKTGRGVPMIPMEEIVILVANLRNLVEQGVRFVMSDRHAYLATANFANDLGGLRGLDWERLRASDFKRRADEPDRFERYQAEALIHQNLPADKLAGVVCYGDEQVKIVSSECSRRGAQLDVVARSSYFF